MPNHPKTASQKRLEGDRAKVGARKAAKLKDPTPKLASTDCPKHLKGYARELWNRVIKELKLSGVDFTVADVAAAEQACIMYQRAREAGDKLNEDGLVIATSDGGYKQNPYVVIERHSTGEYLKLAGQLGLTPVARARLGGESDGDKDDKRKAWRDKMDKVVGNGK